MGDSSATSVGAQGGADTLTAVTVRILGGVDEVDVDAGGAAAADATEAVTPEAPVCDVVLITEDSPEPIRDVTVAVPALRGFVGTADLAVHSAPPECGFRALEGAEATDNENV
nr:hypothetical protein [Halorubrum ezzemoulense]